MSLVTGTVGAGAGFLLLVGLWTPAAGISALALQLWGLLLGIHEPLLAMISGVLGLTIAMIGPGAWSIDARMYGRKHIE